MLNLLPLIGVLFPISSLHMCFSRSQKKKKRRSCGCCSRILHYQCLLFREWIRVVVLGGVHKSISRILCCFCFRAHILSCNDDIYHSLFCFSRSFLYYPMYILPEFWLRIVLWWCFCYFVVEESKGYATGVREECPTWIHGALCQASSKPGAGFPLLFGQPDWSYAKFPARCMNSSMQKLHGQIHKCMFDLLLKSHTKRNIL